MACTGLKIENPDGTISRIKIMTVQIPGFIDVDIYNCNEDFIPIGEPLMSQVEGEEETYHKKLRIESSEKGHFVPEESTDNHWNPGYIELPEDNETTI